MATIRSHVRIHATPETVWEIVGNPARIVEWFPGVTGVEITADTRTLQLASGVPVWEDILTIDDRLRRFQYRITGPLPVKFHLATMDVLEDEFPGCLLVYSTEIDPEPMAFVLDGVISEAITNLAKLAEENEKV